MLFVLFDNWVLQKSIKLHKNSLEVDKKSHKSELDKKLSCYLFYWAICGLCFELKRNERKKFKTSSFLDCRDTYKKVKKYIKKP